MVCSHTSHLVGLDASPHDINYCCRLRSHIVCLLRLIFWPRDKTHIGGLRIFALVVNLVIRWCIKGTEAATKQSMTGARIITKGDLSQAFCAATSVQKGGARLVVKFDLDGLEQSMRSLLGTNPLGPQVSKSLLCTKPHGVQCKSIWCQTRSAGKAHVFVVLLHFCAARGDAVEHQ